MRESDDVNITVYSADFMRTSDGKRVASEAILSTDIDIGGEKATVVYMLHVPFWNSALQNYMYNDDLGRWVQTKLHPEHDLITAQLNAGNVFPGIKERG